MNNVTTEPLEKRIAQDLAPFDAVEAEIAKVKEEYHGLTINGPEDKDGYRMVHKAWQHVREIRLGAEKTHKELKADALAYGKACDARLRQVRDGLGVMEADLYEKWKAEDTRKEREREAARLKEEQEARAEAERIAQEEAERQAAIAAENERKAKELADKEAAMEAEAARIAKEAADRQAAIDAENERRSKELQEREAAMNAKVEEVRVNEVKALGATYSECPAAPFAAYTDMEWLSKLEGIKATVAARIKKEEEDRAKAKADQEAREEAIRAKAQEDERLRIEAEAKAKAEAEAERMRQAGDRGAIEAVIAGIEAIPFNDLKSKKSKDAMDTAASHLRAAVAVLQQAISKK